MLQGMEGKKRGACQPSDKRKRKRIGTLSSRERCVEDAGDAHLEAKETRRQTEHFLSKKAGKKSI